MKKIKITFRSFVLLIALTVIGVNYSNAQWQQTNGPYGGPVSCMTSCGTKIYAGTLYGLYETVNNGAQWTLTGNGFPNTNVNCLASSGSTIAASNGNIVYISTDNGVTWNASADLGMPISALAIKGSNIFAGTQMYGIFLSTNNGQNWTAVNNGLPIQAGTVYEDIFSFAIAGSNIYATIQDGGIYLSTNNGTNWTVVFDPSCIKYTLATNGTDLFVSGDNIGLNISSDNGATWTQFSNGPPPDGECSAIAASGTNIYAYAGAGYMYYSPDNGATWTIANNGLLSTSYKSILINGSSVFVADYGDCGVFLTTNNGANWNPVNDGFLFTNINVMAVSGPTVFAGGGGIFKSINNGTSWTMMNNATTEAGFLKLIVNGSYIYAGCVSDILLSSNNGATWTTILNNCGKALAVNGNNIYVGDWDGIHVSTDNGATWNYYTNGIPGSSDIRALGVIGSNIYAGTEMDGLFVSTDNGINWLLVNSSIIQSNSISSNGSNIYVATDNGLYYSPDNGVNWSTVGNGFPSPASVSTVVYIGTNIFAGTNQGVYMSTNNGASWADVSSSLGVLSFTFDGVNVYAGTNGNGVWKCPLSDFNVSTSSFSSNVFNDLNNNGIKDNNETGLPNVLIKTKSNNWVFNTDLNGNFTAYSYLQNDTITIVNPTNYSTVNPTNYPVTDGDTGKNFAVHYIPNVNDLRVTVTNINLARPGFDDQIRVTYKNTGSTIINGNVTLNFDNSLTYLISIPTQSSINGSTINWNYSNLVPQEQRNINVLFNIPATVPTGTVLNFSGTIYPIIGDTFPANNYNSIEQVVKSSQDPNEKEVIPNDGLTTQQLAAGESLVFTIHFQNTGTDTAFNIKVVDTLSANLDATTFEILASSHPCTFTIRNAGIVEFNFPNILLPDSNVNLIGSNGFVKYAVKPKSNLLLGDSITNTANNYFDYNLPVATNTTNTQIKLETGLVNNIVEEKGILIYPNPANTVISIKYKVKSTGQYKIYNTIGQMLLPGSFAKEEFEINISNLAKGLYFLELENEDAVVVKRFVKE